jgi:hypothetical protein
MIQVSTFSNSIEAQMACDFLISNGIQCQIVGAKEYASHVVGGSVGNYILMVNSDDAKKASEMLEGLKTEHSQKNNIGELDSGSKNQPDFFQRAVALSLISFFMLPIIGNACAVYNGVLFIKGSEKTFNNFAKLGLVLSLQVLFIFFAYFVYIKSGES